MSTSSAALPPPPPPPPPPPAPAAIDSVSRYRCRDLRAMAEDLEFPATIGPFTMHGCRAGDAMNAFYRQHDFPRPDPSSDENSMAGVDPAPAGLGIGEIMFCQLSPLHAITLDAESKAAANIPQSSTHFAWCYPAVLYDGRVLGASLEELFLKFGGYVYFDERGNAVGANCIAPAALGTLGLMFGRPQPLAKAVEEKLTLEGRFQEITLDALADKGATHFAWIRPAEFADSIACSDGCFAYKFREGGSKYFPVVAEPVFTPELVAETLDESEAWAIVRTSPPSVERPAIFDKSKSFMENLEAGSNNNLVQAEDSEVVVFRDGAGDVQMTYTQWQESPSQGTIANPWVFAVECTANGTD